MSPCFPNTSLTCKAMVFLEVSIVFKKIIDYMTRLSFVIQKMHNENKCSNFAMDIHKSKFMVQELQNFKVLIMNFSLVFFTILNKISLTMFHLDGKIN